MPEGRTGSSFGERLQEYREGRGMTRAVLGGLVGRGEEWVKAVENGRIAMPRLPMLIRLSEVLQVNDLADLTGEERLTKATYGKARHPSLSTVSRSLAGYPQLRPDREPVSADALAAGVSQAWVLWHRSAAQRTAIAPLLPRLLDDARVSARLLEGGERRRALRSLAQIYHLTQLFLSFQPAHDQVVLTGDRAMAAAQDADDPAAIAAAAWYMNHVYRDAGEQAEARIELSQHALRLLRPADDEVHRAMVGLLHLAMALSYAKTGRKGDAWRHWDESSRAARTLEAPHPWLMFGPGMVDAYAITMHADLTDGHDAVKVANRIEIHTAMPSLTRQAFHTIETARAYHLRREPVAMVHLLRKALRLSRDTTMFNLFTRSTVLELAASGGATVREDARELARELRLTPAA
jgi:transcriptional regulator with XRE-family HTH domain